MIRNTVCLFLFSLLALSCADYGGYEDPECEGVVCNSPPADACVDGLTNPHISQEEAAASLTGMTLEYWCADGTLLKIDPDFICD